MILSLLVIVLIVLIALFYYTQGLFAATVAVVCAAVAALMAFSYHETVVVNYAAVNLGSYGNALALVVIFAVVFIGLRMIIDNFLPGNVRYPVFLDRIGAPVMGVIVGVFGTAVMVLAAQQLPFGPRIAMYSPYPTENVEYIVDRRLAPIYRLQMGDDAVNKQQLTIPRLDTEQAQEQRRSLWLPVDEWFLGLVRQLDGDGALAGRQRLEDVYPDYKTALFGQRIGLQRAATQVAYNVQGRQDVTVPNVYLLQTGEGTQFPNGVPQVQGDLGRRPDIDPILRPRPGHELIVVRTNFSHQIADRAQLVRFGPANARLVINGEQYFPIATLESAQVAVSHLPDDFLLAAQGADLIYEVDRSTALTEGGQRLAGNAFLEFKRFARVDLSGRELRTRINPSASTHVMRKRPVQEWIAARVGNRPPSDRIDEFQELRESVPEEDTPEPEEMPVPDEAEEDTSPMGIIRREGGERRQIIEGDED